MSHLRGTRFRDDDELMAATEAWFGNQTDDFYFKGINCLKEKCTKCIKVKRTISKNNIETIFQSVSYAPSSMNLLDPIVYQILKGEQYDRNIRLDGRNHDVYL